MSGTSIIAKISISLIKWPYRLLQEKNLFGFPTRLNNNKLELGHARTPRLTVEISDIETEGDIE